MYMPACYIGMSGMQHIYFRPSVRNAVPPDTLVFQQPFVTAFCALPPMESAYLTRHVCMYHFPSFVVPSFGVHLSDATKLAL